MGIRRDIARKVGCNQGATLVMALLLLLVVGVVSAVILAAAVSSMRAVNDDYQRQDDQLVLDSAVYVVRESLAGTQVKQVKKVKKNQVTYTYSSNVSKPTALQELSVNALENVIEGADSGAYSQSNPYSKTFTVTTNDTKFSTVSALFEMYPAPNASEVDDQKPAYMISIVCTYENPESGSITREYLSAECTVKDGTGSQSGERIFEWAMPQASNREAR